MAEATKTENLAQALAKVQGKLPNIKKDAKGNFGKYVTLDAIHEAILPLLSANGLAWVTMPTYDESGEGILEYQLLHVSGEKIEGKMRLLTGQQTPQGQGSAITYAKRYSICAVIGVTADEDDDGTAGSTSEAPKYQKKTYPAKKPDVFPPEEAKDIKADEPMDGVTKVKLARALEHKGITDIPTITHVLNKFSDNEFKVKEVGNLTQDQAIQLLNLINGMAPEALGMLIEE